jgi:hypothetical protein
MKRSIRHRQLVVIATVLLAVPVVAVGAPVGFEELARLSDTVLEIPCRIATNLRNLPERMNPTRSECN